MADFLVPLYLDGKTEGPRARLRIKSVLDYCEAKDWIASNPANGALDGTLPKFQHTTAHHAALAWTDAPVAYKALEADAPTAAMLAVRFAMLTACRVGEIVGARWGEIEGATWTIPGSRMKAGRTHVVPLSAEALEVLRLARGLAQDDRVFPGGRGSKGSVTLQSVSRALKRHAPSATTHGLRSTFRDWCAETGVPQPVAERALAHTIGNAVQAAYCRTTLLDQRREVMADWADYIG